MLSLTRNRTTILFGLCLVVIAPLALSPGAGAQQYPSGTARSDTSVSIPNLPQQGSSGKPMTLNQANAPIPKEKLEQYSQLMVAVLKASQDYFSQLSVLDKEMQSIIRQPTLNRNAYITKFREMQGLRAKMELIRIEASVAFAEKLKPEERAWVLSGSRPVGASSGEAKQ